jgi:alanine racemase
MINQPTIEDPSSRRPTSVSVDLGRLSANWEAIKAFAAPAKAMLVVKANAYGHGLFEVVRHLGSRADAIGVAVLEEGLLLRRMGISTPILVMGGVWADQIPEYIRHDLTLTASSIGRLKQIAEAASALGCAAKVHLKIDTGMERVGVHYYNAESLLEAALKCGPHVAVEGVYSHFANADAEDLSDARLQLERFLEVLRFYEKRDLPAPTRHMANSAALLRLPESRLDMVRPGILAYGVYPAPHIPRTIDVLPALSWTSRVVYFKVVRAGDPVGYGSTWRSDHPVRVVTVPVGYGDGYFRSMSNQARVLIRGRSYPQVGAICMDQIMVSIESDSAFNGDRVVLVGEDGGERITVEDLARWAGTIPYEILTAINTRVPRIYAGG